MKKRLLSILICGCMIVGLNPVGGSSAMSADPELYNGIPLATGSGVTAIPEPQGPFFNILDYGAESSTDYGAAYAATGKKNQTAIDSAINAAAEAGGGTVIIPSGDFSSFTIHLKSNVRIHLESDASIIRSAVNSGDNAYDAPEMFQYVGLQDHGHSHFANSLIYGKNVSNVVISGPGLIDGSYINTSGTLVNVLSGSDPSEVNRNQAGAAAGANKAIALWDCQDIILTDFKILNGGHFAIIGEGVVGWTVNNLIIDTNRDAINVDCCQDVTIRNSVFNSLTDDAIVLKASFGVGRFMPTRNILIEDNVVSGYDAGSVLNRTYTTDKLVATDRCGPTARIKLGTEGTCGFDRVTIRGVVFDRSRGFCLEAVDGADLTNVILTDCVMQNVSSSPIYIRVGDRGRSPVTGVSTSETRLAPAPNVRLDNTEWVLPDLPEKYLTVPAGRYIPSYTRNRSVPIGGGTNVTVVSDTAPTRLNPGSIYPEDPLYANAVGPANVAKVKNIYIGGVEIKNVDPRYPILLAGLVDSKIENVTIENINVEYRGGLKMRDAVEQRQISTSWSYTQYKTAPATLSPPWLVNTFFSGNESLLPRVTWDSEEEKWVDNPYNIPEQTREYPEPSNFGILPAYGIYARHVDGLKINNVNIGYIVPDERHAVVLDDVHNADFSGFSAMTVEGVETFALVSNTMKRKSNFEYVKDYPYISTGNTNITMPESGAVKYVTVGAPAPGTPNDGLYDLPTAPSAEYPYSFEVSNADYQLPLTVHRPYFSYLEPQVVRAGGKVEFTVEARNPATDYPTNPLPNTLVYSASNLPEGAAFDPETRVFGWTPSESGVYTVTFTIDDGVIPVSKDVTVTVLGAAEISTPVDTIVEGYAANIPVDVKLSGVPAITLELYKPDGTLFDTITAASGGRYTFRLGAADAAAGVFEVRASLGDETLSRLEFECVERPVDLWTPVVVSTSGETVVRFGADVTFGAAKGVKINGVPVQSNLVSAEGKLVAIARGSEKDDVIVISGVKYAKLFPSYSFTFTITVKE